MKHKYSQSVAVILLFIGACTAPVITAAEEGVPNEALGYAGSAACIDCHKDQSLSGPHAAQKDPESPAGKFGCESCHGPALEHARFQEDGKPGDDPSIPAMSLGKKSTLSPAQRSAVCVECHSNGNHALWDGSIHERRDLACGDCHRSHTKNEKYLAEKSESELCFTCHKDIRAQLQKVSHHPLREGKMQCSDCHNSHGTVGDKLINAVQVNEKCYECHAERRGPFLWEHAPVTENCLNCHTPHGSSHEKLLVNKEPFLCQSCHSEARHPGTLYALSSGSADRSPFSALSNRAFYRSCGNCHGAVHGSNHPSGKTLER